MKRLTPAEIALCAGLFFASFIIYTIFLTVTSDVEPVKTINAESFQCSTTVSRPVGIFFRSLRQENYNEYAAIISIGENNFYALITQIDNKNGLKIKQHNEFIAIPGRGWAATDTLPDDFKKRWPGIENLFSNEEKMALWRCFRKARGYQYT